MIWKGLGLALFLLGLSIILFTLVESYTIFVGEDQVPQLFSPDEFESPEEESLSGGIEDQIRGLIGQETQKQIKNIIPPTAVARMLNLFSWSIFSGIAIFSGTKISGLGISLIKKE